MILLVDLSWRPNSLSRDEFVGPVARIVDRVGMEWRETHFSMVRNRDIEGATGIILCGTALKDNFFATKVQEYSQIWGSSVPVLGICAGMQALCRGFGGTIYPGCEIGMTTIRAGEPPDPFLDGRTVFEAYELHSFACDPPPGWVVMAVSDSCIQAVRHPDRQLYGVMFHPEVRNEWVVERFCALSQKYG